MQPTFVTVNPEPTLMVLTAKNSADSCSDPAQHGPTPAPCRPRLLVCSAPPTVQGLPVESSTPTDRLPSNVAVCSLIAMGSVSPRHHLGQEAWPAPTWLSGVCKALRVSQTLSTRTPCVKRWPSRLNSKAVLGCMLTMMDGYCERLLASVLQRMSACAARCQTSGC